MAEHPSLIDFAKESANHPRGKPCWVCTIPEREEIDEARRSKSVGPSVILDWLVNTCEYSKNEATVGKLANHFNQRHHVLEDGHGENSE